MGKQSKRKSWSPLKAGEGHAMCPSTNTNYKHCITWEIEMFLIQLPATQIPYTIINNVSSSFLHLFLGQSLRQRCCARAAGGTVGSHICDKRLQGRDVSDKAQAHQDWNRTVLGTHCSRPYPLSPSWVCSSSQGTQTTFLFLFLPKLFRHNCTLPIKVIYLKKLKT